MIDSSPQKQQDLHEAQTFLGNRDVDPVEKYAKGPPLNVIQDVVVHWWSTYDMCERLLFLREAFDYMDQMGKLRGSKDKKSDPSRNLTEEEWEVTENLALLLAPWKEALKVLESNSYVSSSLVLFLVNVLSGELDHFIMELPAMIDDDAVYKGMSESLVDCAEQMLADFEER